MSYQADIQDAQRVYKDILNGYSFFYHQNEKLYIKHLSDADHGWIQEYRKTCFERVKEKGIQTEGQQIESLIKQGVWEKEKENRIPSLKNEINNLSTSKSKLKLRAQKASIDRTIDRRKEMLLSLEQERESLLGVTCENYSDKKVNERYLFYTCYLDSDLKQQKFTEEEFEDLEPNQIYTLVEKNNKILMEISTHAIKRIAASPFFLNNMMISKNNPMVFFGKPIIKLTNYQTELFSTGLRFRNIIESSRQTPPVSESLDKVLEWYENTAGAMAVENEEEKNIHSNARGVSSTIVGAQKDEVEAMAGDTSQQAKSLHEEAKKHTKKGSSVVDMHGMMKIHGEL